MAERNGVRVGQQVRDLDGRSLGRVTRLFPDGFATRKGLPFLIREDFVLRYDEVRGVRDGALVVARSSSDLLDLSAGYIPPSWRVPVPPGFPKAATPPEARFLREDLARGAIDTGRSLETERVAAPVEGEAPSRDLPLPRQQRGETAGVRGDASSPSNRS
jgi:hypothetical protein